MYLNTLKIKNKSPKLITIYIELPSNDSVYIPFVSGVHKNLNNLILMCMSSFTHRLTIFFLIYTYAGDRWCLRCEPAIAMKYLLAFLFSGCSESVF